MCMTITRRRTINMSNYGSVIGLLMRPDYLLINMMWWWLVGDGGDVLMSYGPMRDNIAGKGNKN